MAKKKAAAAKRRRAQDITVINLRAVKKLINKLEAKLTSRIERRCKGAV
jgi:hypothetical protein